jgi:hypothetical protein
MAEMHKHFDNEKQDELDRTLDAALAKYSAVEPRAGLEDRVLANLRSERARVPDRVWWHWSMAAALAAMVVALALASRSSGPSRPAVANHSSTRPQGLKQAVTPDVAIGDGNQLRGNQARLHQRAGLRGATMHRPQAKLVADNPKLDQFPSPQPLSEQEKILASYVEKYPEQAVLLARARTEALRQDQLEKMKAFPSGSRATDSEELNSDSTER